MKKSLLVFGAGCVALCGMASAPAPSQHTAVPSDYKNRLESNGFGNLRIAGPASAKLPAKAGAIDDIITSVDGKQEMYTINGSGFFLFFGVIFDYYENQDVPSHVVYGDNDEVYVYNMIPNFECDSYVKGKKDGNTVVFDFPQTVYYDEDMADTVGVTLFNPYQYEENGETGESYAPVDGPVTVTFTIGEDGVWTTDDVTKDQLLGTGYCSSGYKWNGYGAIELSIRPFTDKLVTVPDGVEVSKNFWVYDAGGYGLAVNWAQGENEVYLQGLSQFLPDAWIMGKVETVDGTTVINIPQNQYLGMVDNSYIYTKCATIGETPEGMPIYVLEPEDEEFQLIWNTADNTLTAKNPGVSFLVNKSKNDLYYLEEFMDMKLTHQDSFAGVPANPDDLEYDDFTIYGNWGYFRFNVPAMSTDGKYLLTKDLYYIVYVDDDEWEFDADEYDIEESLVEVPWGFNSYYINKWPAGKREVDFFMSGISTLGVQSVYKYDGEETRSEIVTLDLEEGNAVGAVEAGKKVAGVKYYDLSGREVAAPAAGIVVKRVTFDDGSVTTFKKAIH